MNNVNKIKDCWQIIINSIQVCLIFHEVETNLNKLSISIHRFFSIFLKTSWFPVQGHAMCRFFLLHFFFLWTFAPVFEKYLDTFAQNLTKNQNAFRLTNLKWILCQSTLDDIIVDKSFICSTKFLECEWWALWCWKPGEPAECTCSIQ